MDVKRRRVRNELLLSIKTANNIITRSDETIVRMKYSDMNPEYVSAQIEKLKETIKKKLDIVADAEKKLSELGCGSLDKKINEEHEENKKIIEGKKAETERIKLAKKKYKEKNKEVSKTYWKTIIAESRGHRQKLRDMRYGNKHYNRCVDSLPNYIKKNLSEMPNNKGYIWRGVYFYGRLPYRERDPRILFEKCRGVLTIHEYSDRYTKGKGYTDYRRFEKIGRTRKRLIERKVTPKKLFGKNLMDYCVKK